MALLGNYLSIKDDVCVEWVVLGLGGVGVEMVHVGVGEKNISIWLENLYGETNVWMG